MTFYSKETNLTLKCWDIFNDFCLLSADFFQNQHLRKIFQEYHYHHLASKSWKVQSNSNKLFAMIISRQHRAGSIHTPNWIPVTKTAQTGWFPPSQTGWLPVIKTSKTGWLPACETVDYKVKRKIIFKFSQPKILVILHLSSSVMFHGSIYNNFV